MFKKILNLFKSDITVIKSQNKDIMRNIVMLYSKGNINLQKGNYITSNIVKEKQKDIFLYKFVI